eukprot:CAMPEP_0202478954 /NCGR_PEP_ID=MMETSP1360-20130828/94733_1 /ASSEMBLY_ACC=CAM_ASM_000848 /TAXON_ID=515479 /ORGANISM="Licmophora paradoxa, Strain CCMP2313" /LENGTH=62 /DNA_ID=CAMNT_0049106261 /DNA_START=89 /DNA_END=274 /DNA_ORIENTATION=+
MPELFSARRMPNITDIAAVWRRSERFTISQHYHDTGYIFLKFDEIDIGTHFETVAKILSKRW